MSMCLLSRPRADYWTEREMQILRRVFRNRVPASEFCQYLPGRSPKAIKAMASKMGLVTWRRVPDLTRTQVSAKTVPEHLLVDRERRASEPRTLTMQLMGDPSPSRSALAKVL